MKLAFAVAGLSLFAAGCSTAWSSEMAPRAIPSPVAVSGGGVTVKMIAATLAEDCGGTGAPYTAPEPHAAPGGGAPGRSSNAKMGARACQQTSMQLSVVADASLKEAATITVKKVEFLDEKGKSFGELTPRSPMQWSSADSVYKEWNQKIEPGKSLSVSYALSAPDWSKVDGRWGRIFVVKATLSVGGKDFAVERQYETRTETHLPPGAVT